MAPSTNGANGRDAGGRFAKGHPGGPGNPHAKKVARIRARLLKLSTPADIDAICRQLIDGAKGGDLAMIKEWLDRTVGKPTTADIEARLSALEATLQPRSTP